MENLLAPLEALSRLDGSRALVLAHHPGDEVFGCGGVLCAHVASGDLVRVIVVTDGGAGAVEEMRADSVQVRRAECLAAAEVLGYADLQFWGVRDRDLRFNEELVVRVQQGIDEFSPTLVYAPSIYEFQPVHRVLGLVVQEAVRRSLGNLQLVMYELSAPLRHNKLLDISLFIDKKMRAMQCFLLQERRQRFGSMIAALNTYRACLISAEVTSAEAFITIDGDALSSDPLKLYKDEHLRLLEMELELNSDSEPLVSIVVRSMNRPELRDALDSIALQTYTNIEVIVVNACGHGHRELPLKCGRFPLRMIDSDVPTPRANAANKGLNVALGQFVIFLDDDDWFDPGHVAKLARALRAQPLFLAAYAGVRCVDEHGKPLPKVFDHPFDAARLLAGNYIPFHALMFSRELMTRGCRLDESFSIYEDWDFWVQLSLHTDFLKLEGRSAVYRIAGQSGFGVNRPTEMALQGDWQLYKKWFPRFRDCQINGIVQALINLEERNAQLFQATSDIEARERQVSHLSAAVQALSSEVQRQSELLLRNEVQSKQALDGAKSEIVQLQRELWEVRTHLNAVLNSTPWRLTKPVRAIKRAILKIHYLDDGRRFVLGAARLVFRVLPLKHSFRARMRNWISRHFPSLLVANHEPIGFSVSGSGFQLPKVPDQFKNALEFAQTLRFERPLQPEVSVIIPVYGKVEYTLHCLASLSKHLQRTAFEVIVVNDCSPDESEQALRLIEGLTVVNQPQNRGFVRSCNVGAKHARGKFLLFLNNDTEVTPGWLDELVRTFVELPGTGLVGSKLIYPDGRLQEAGGIVWQDGSAWNFGRLQNPLLPEFNYAREVDYCSGASIMVPSELFADLNGFDEHFSPAYCEDTDLALKIRQRGLRVLYQPMSVVVHFEGVTSGTDTASGIKAYQVTNTHKLFERWKSVLQEHQQNGVDVDSAKDRRAKRRVLVLDHCTPTPDQDSGSIDTYNLMLLLREMVFQVTFIPEDNFLYMPPYTNDLQRVGIEVVYAPYCLSVEEHLKIHGDRYDLAFVIRPGVLERHQDVVRKYCTKAQLIFHTVDLHFLRMGREAELLADKNLQVKADEMKAREMNLINAADMATVISEYEYEMLSPLVPSGKLALLPYARNIGGTHVGFTDRSGIVFVGGYQHAPNVDAMRYFVADVMPLLRQRLPGVKLHIVGSKPPPDIQCLATDDIVVEGFVADLEPFLDGKRISIAPLRYGAGIKGKVGTAMAAGIPVVATPIAAEGMGLTNQENVLIAETADEFADAVVALYQDAQLWTRISRNGLVFAENTWGATAAWKNLAQVLERVGLAPPTPAYPLSLYK